MKRIMGFLMAGAIMLSLVGCGAKSPQTPNNTVAEGNTSRPAEETELQRPASNNETTSSPAEAEPSASPIDSLTVVSSGTYDGVPYAFLEKADGTYHLTIGETGKTYTYLGEPKTTSSWPWYHYQDIITSAEFLGTVIGTGDMAHMFFYMGKLESIDFTNFRTEGMTDMSSMFMSCVCLKDLDLSNFDTTSVRDMHQLFWKCNSLTKLDLSTFDTTSATDLSSMFQWCENLEEVDISGFDTANAITTEYMFRNCPNLSKITVGAGFINASRGKFLTTFPGTMRSENSGAVYNADDVIPDGADIYTK